MQLKNFSEKSFGYVIPKLVHPLVRKLRLRWIWSRVKRCAVYMKLDPVKVERMVEEREKWKLTDAQIAETMKTLLCHDLWDTLTIAFRRCLIVQ